MQGMAKEPARVEGRGLDLIEESDPRTTDELLTEWETLAGLPDDTSDLAPTKAERRQHLEQKILTRGGQSRHHFEEIASHFGFTVTVANYTVARCGQARCGDRCYGITWAYYFTVTGPATVWQKARCGQARCGDRIVEVGNKVLEKTIRKFKPAHTDVHFFYPV